MWFDDEFEQEFQRLSSRFFNWGDVFETPMYGNKVKTIGPYYYGYTMTVGPDGRPIVKEYGNIRPSTALAASDVREPFVDDILDKDNNALKLVTEMPGIDKSDIKVNVEGRTVTINAERGDRKYKARVPLKYKVDENSAKATYSNGILEIKFKIAEDKPKGKTVSVE